MKAFRGYMFTGCYSNVIYVWNKARRCVATLKGCARKFLKILLHKLHTHFVRLPLFFRHDRYLHCFGQWDNQLVSGSGEGLVCVWGFGNEAGEKAGYCLTVLSMLFCTRSFPPFSLRFLSRCTALLTASVNSANAPMAGGLTDAFDSLSMTDEQPQITLVQKYNLPKVRMRVCFLLCARVLLLCNNSFRAVVSLWQCFAHARSLSLFPLLPPTHAIY